MVPSFEQPSAPPPNGISSSWNSSQTAGGFNQGGAQANGGMPQQSHILCGGCGILLYYSQGANNVRCARCGHITSSKNAQRDVAQLVCTGCRVLLMYPRGANSVQCSLCGTINSAQQANKFGHVTCPQCRTTLMYIFGAATVRCVVCKHVTATNPEARASGDSGTSRSAQQAQHAPHASAVVVENPPGEGTENDQYVIGVKHEADCTPDPSVPGGSLPQQLTPSAPPAAAGLEEPGGAR